MQDKILEIACCILYRLKGSEKEGFQRKVIRANDTFLVEGRQGQWRVRLMFIQASEQFDKVFKLDFYRLKEIIFDEICYP